jgi:hypothetical protein
MVRPGAAMTDSRRWSRSLRRALNASHSYDRQTEPVTEVANVLLEGGVKIILLDVPSIWDRVYGVAAREMTLADGGYDALHGGGSDCQNP